jgi:hypothetical protein
MAGESGLLHVRIAVRRGPVAITRVEHAANDNRPDQSAAFTAATLHCRPHILEQRRCGSTSASSLLALSVCGIGVPATRSLARMGRRGRGHPDRPFRRFARLAFRASSIERRPGRWAGQLGTYFWYQPHANVSPNGRWALFTSNWEKTLGTATNSEPDGIYRTDVFVVRLLSGTFADAPLTSGSFVKAVHFTELRARIDVARVTHGLSPFLWTDPDLGPGFTIKAVHLTDLRTALQQAYAAAKQPPPSFGESLTVRVTPVRAAHIEELRSAVLALEGG